jgi:hypothetical protein
MALKIPETAVADSVAGDGWLTQRGLMEKRGWQCDRAIQGNPTISILRYTESGGDAAAEVEPAYSLTVGLANIPAAVYDRPRELSRKYGSLFETGDIEIVVYPTVSGQDVEIVATDIVEYESEQYRAVGGTVNYDSKTGRCAALVRMGRPS